MLIPLLSRVFPELVESDVAADNLPLSIHQAGVVVVLVVVVLLVPVVVVDNLVVDILVVVVVCRPQYPSF